MALDAVEGYPGGYMELGSLAIVIDPIRYRSMMSIEASQL